MNYSNDIVKNRILVTGSNGMLGQALCRFYSAQNNARLAACSVEDQSWLPGIDYFVCDITSRESIKKLVYDFYPDFIINAAAFTNVDLSETEREAAWKINVKGVEHLAECARVIDAHLIHISTDYIFDGKNGPYTETAKPHPLSYYARTKLASENALKISGAACTILRTNVLYGNCLNGKMDFVNWVVGSLRKGNEIRIVTDQINNPTFVDDLVQAISRVVEYRKQGIFNIGGKELLSRYDFSRKIADFFELNSSLIKPIKTEELNQPAKRPLCSGLVTLKAETELNYRPHSIYESLLIMKREQASLTP
jgi:dTDP-4-dehydrorhamnose reductase